MPLIPSTDKDLQRGKRFKTVCSSLFPRMARAKIAEALNASGESRIRNFESGVTIECRVLARLSQRGCNLDWLLTGEGEMLRQPASLPQLPSGLSPDKLHEMAKDLTDLADQLEQTIKIVE